MPSSIQGNFKARMSILLIFRTFEAISGSCPGGHCFFSIAYVVDEWRIFDNAPPSIPQLILSGKGSTIKIHQETKWQKLLKLAEKNQS